MDDENHELMYEPGPGDSFMTTMLSCDEDIDDLVDTMETGAIIFFNAGRYNSLVSFAIQIGCNSTWTHAGMIVRPSKTGKDVYIWESVNNHSETSAFIDVRTRKAATGSGVRLIDFRKYIKAGYGCLKKPEVREKQCKFGVLPLRDTPGKAKLQARIVDYVLHQSLTLKEVYPTDYGLLIKSWWDGWQSCFVCCGCFTTYEVEELNLTPASGDVPKSHSHYKAESSQSVGEQVFCSQLVIETLEKSGFFHSNIPCYEWTVDDLSRGENINTWLDSKKVAYTLRPQIKVLFCKK